MNNRHTENTKQKKHQQILSTPFKTFSVEKIYTCDPMEMLRYHYHSSYELYYLYKGERYYFIKDKSYHITEGTFVLINKYDIHYTTSPAGNGFERIVLNFDDTFIEDTLYALGNTELIDCFKKNIPIIKLEKEDVAYAQSLLDTIFDEFNSKNDDYLMYIKSSLIQLMIFISRYQKNMHEIEPDYINSLHKTISDITGYINNHFQENITLDFLAESYFLSPYYLSRTFKSFTGLSFVEYLNGVRIKEAQRLLYKTDMSVSKISEAVGFNSTTHFGRVFKKIAGVSPLVYRKINC